MAAAAASASAALRAGYRLADITHALSGENLHILDEGPIPLAGHIGRRNDGAHAGHAAGGIHMQRLDARIGLAGTAEFAMQHAGKGKIRTVDRLAGHLAHCIETRMGFAHNPVIGRHVR